MTLATKNIDQLKQLQATAIQAKSADLTDFSVGSNLLAMVESNTSVQLWMQALLLQVLASERLATSTGNDVDTYLADFGLSRLAAVAATGNVTFSRKTASQQAIVPVGALVETDDGAVQYAVIADSTNPAYSSTLNGYVINAGTASITALVQAQTAGSIGNAGIGFIDTLSSAIPGVDSVTNAAAFTSGADTESDAAARMRFVDYLAGLAKASVPAIKFAIENIQNGIVYEIVENTDYATGTARKGYFYVIIGDNPSPTLLQSVFNTVDATRACGIQFEYHADIATAVNVTVTVKITSGADQSSVQTAVTNAITSYINNTPIGATLYYNNLYPVIKDAVTDGSFITASNLLLNGGTSDITADTEHQISAGTVTVTIVVG